MTKNRPVSIHLEIEGQNLWTTGIQVLLMPITFLGSRINLTYQDTINYNFKYLKVYWTNPLGERIHLFNVKVNVLSVLYFLLSRFFCDTAPHLKRNTRRVKTCKLNGYQKYYSIVNRKTNWLMKRSHRDRLIKVGCCIGVVLLVLGLWYMYTTASHSNEPTNMQVSFCVDYNDNQNMYIWMPKAVRFVID